jgi:hypothetical protein
MKDAPQRIKNKDMHADIKLSRKLSEWTMSSQLTKWGGQCVGEGVAVNLWGATEGLLH